MKRIVLVGLILTLGCIDQGGFLYKEEVAEVFEDSAEGVTSLDFETYNGFIEVHLWDQQTYKVEVKKWARAATSAEAKEKAESIEVDFSAGETLHLEVHQERNAGADVTAYLPRKSFDSIELYSSNGFIGTDEISASTVTLETSNGSIDVSIIADDIKVETSNGKIGGFFQGGSVDIETSNGFVDIECGDGGEYTVRTSNGRVTIETGARGTFDISTSNGSVNITVAGDFEFDLRTSNASIAISAAGVTYTLDSKDHKKGSTAADVEIFIEASTSNGSISVTKK